MADHRPDVYTRDDGTMVFRVSSFARCDRALIAAGLELEGGPPPEKMLRAFERGQAAEWGILRSLGALKSKVLWRDGSEVKLGYNVLDPGLMGSYRNLGPAVDREAHDGQFAIELPVGDDMVIYGHMDGAGSVYMTGEYEVATGTTLILEGKRFGPEFFKRWKDGGIRAFPSYDTQTDLYMHASGCELLFLVGEGRVLEDGEVSDEEGDFGQVWAELKSKPSRPLAYYASRARRLRKQIETGVLPGECERGVEYPCPFWWLHEDAGKERIDLTARADDPQVRRIAELAETLAGLNGEIKERETAAAPIKAELRDLVIAVAGGEGCAVLTERHDINHVYSTWGESTVPAKVKKAGTKSYVVVKSRG